MVLAPVTNKYSGKIKLKMLSQHHCSPPPDSEAVVGWLKALRKRYGKIIKAMEVVNEEENFAREREEVRRSEVAESEERAINAIFTRTTSNVFCILIRRYDRRRDSNLARSWTRKERRRRKRRRKRKRGRKRRRLRDNSP